MIYYIALSNAQICRTTEMYKKTTNLCITSTNVYKQQQQRLYIKQQKRSQHEYITTTWYIEKSKGCNENK